ncbi:hypothetical protein ABZN43_08085 [Campylobacter jejuni]|nr:hypothetical protein QMK15_05450 [Campylobacter jejuni]
MSSGIFLSFTDSYGDILIIRFLTGLVLAESISNYFEIGEILYHFMLGLI